MKFHFTLYKIKTSEIEAYVPELNKKTKVYIETKKIIVDLVDHFSVNNWFLTHKDKDNKITYDKLVKFVKSCDVSTNTILSYPGVTEVEAYNKKGLIPNSILLNNEKVFKKYFLEVRNTGYIIENLIKNSNKDDIFYVFIGYDNKFISEFTK